MATESIFDLKKDFLSSQIRILAGELNPPRGWQDRVPEGEDGDLSERVVEQVLYKLNIVARKHQKLAYSSQALRLVAEQIDALYWEKNDAGGNDLTSEEDVLRRGVDLKDPQNIDLLPESFPAEGGETEEELEEYQILKARLSNSSEALRAQRQRHAYYMQLKSILEPFTNPQESIQPNLVTRDGHLNKELERMRVLAAKLAITIERARLGAGNEREGREENENEKVEEQLQKMLEN